MAASNADQGSSPPPAGAGPAQHAPPDDKEEIYYEGHPLLRGQRQQIFTWGLSGLVLIALPFLFHHFFADASVAWWFYGVCVVLGVILLMVPAMAARSVRYKISNYRIDYERGVLSKTIDTVELWHVEDLRLTQSLLDRIFGVGTIRITSHDQTLPEFYLRAVPKARALFDTLKGRVIAVKRQRGVIKLDSGE